jgi:phosphate transport system permease protein/phosphate transport system substrate-binding protein
VSPGWSEKIGKGNSVEWPTGVGAPGNEGVANGVRSTFNSIGYVELAYALTTDMDYAFIQNKDGKFIEPSLGSTAAAVGMGSQSLPAGDAYWGDVHLLDAPGPDSYPIASFTYLLLYKELSTSPTIDSMAKAKAIVDFVAWAVSDEGQVFAEELSYVPLPDSVQELDMETLGSLTYNGQTVLGGTVEPPGPTEEPFSFTATHDGASYSVSGKGTGIEATSVSVTPAEYVTVELEGSGEIELTLPKTMVADITMIRAGNSDIDFETVSQTSSTTTISFMVPEGTDSVDIHAAMVVPEFNVIALLVLAASIVGVVAYTRFKGIAMSGMKLGSGQA